MRPGTGTGDDDDEQSPSEAAPLNPRCGQPTGQRRQKAVVAIACGAMLVTLGIYLACGILARSDAALPHLIEASRSGEWRVRSLAALAVAASRSMAEDRLRRLRELSTDSEGDVAENARFAIGLVHGEAPTSGLPDLGTPR